MLTTLENLAQFPQRQREQSIQGLHADCKWETYIIQNLQGYNKEKDFFLPAGQKRLDKSPASSNQTNNDK